jgi:hypothetical protein
MYLEKIFTLVGRRIDTDLIAKIADKTTPQLPEQNAKSEQPLTAKETKAQQEKLEARKKQMLEIFKASFKRFVGLIEKFNYQSAALELLELVQKVPEVNARPDFHALMTLSYVASRRYELAEAEEKLAVAGDAKWQIFDEITDDISAAADFFIADELKIPLNKLNFKKKIVGEWHWDDKNVNAIIENLRIIFKLEHEKIAEIMAAEETKIQIKEEDTLNDLVIQLCNQFILPFYVRLELSQIASNAKPGAA